MGARDELFGDDPGPLPSPPSSPLPHTHTSWSSSALKKSPAGRGRSGSLPCPPQERVLRRTVQQIVDAVPSFPILGDPAPQVVEQLPNVMHFFDTLTPDPEQVIEVPKILPDDVSMQTTVRDTQLAEQLVEVPTIMSSLQRIVEQNVDIPVPGGGGRLAGLQGFLPGQSSTASPVQQIVDIPGGGLQGSHPGEDSPASSSSVSPAGSDDDADEPGDVFFSHFSRPPKSTKVTRHSSARVPQHVSSSTLSAHQMAPHCERTTWYDEEREQAWCRLEDRLGRSFWRLLS